jgi:hypothetical protein
MYNKSLILTVKTKICRTNVLSLLSDQNLQPQALTTDHETRHCIHVFLNAYRKTSTARYVTTSSLSRQQYEWHDWTCYSPQLWMQQFKRSMHESSLCLLLLSLSVAYVSRTRQRTNRCLAVAPNCIYIRIYTERERERERESERQREREQGKHTCRHPYIQTKKHTYIYNTLTKNQK